MDVSLSWGLCVTSVSLLLVLALFGAASDYSEYGRNSRTEFAFRLPVSFYPLIPICWLGASYILQTRRWFVATAIMLLLSVMATPPFAWLGPGYQLAAVMPLVNLRSAIGIIFVVFCAVLAFLFRPRPS